MLSILLTPLLVLSCPWNNLAGTHSLSTEATISSDSNLACPVPTWQERPCLSNVKIFQVSNGNTVSLNGTHLNFQFTAAWTVVNPRTGPATGGGEKCGLCFRKLCDNVVELEPFDFDHVFFNVRSVLDSAGCRLFRYHAVQVRLQRDWTPAGANCVCCVRNLTYSPLLLLPSVGADTFVEHGDAINHDRNEKRFGNTFRRKQSYSNLLQVQCDGLVVSYATSILHIGRGTSDGCGNWLYKQWLDLRGHLFCRTISSIFKMHCVIFIYPQVPCTR